MFIHTRTHLHTQAWHSIVLPAATYALVLNAFLLESFSTNI
jgi:hypothetical protein